MIGRQAFVSESGLRPMSAFVVVGVVLVAAAVQVGRAAFAGGEPARRVAVERALDPGYDLLDRRGRLAARFVPRFDLVVSPRSAWRRHTPDRIASRISEALGGRPNPVEVLGALLPDAEDGVVVARGLALGRAEAERVAAWLEAEDLAGVALEELPADEGEPARWTLAWRPALVLSADERALHGHGGPAGWTSALVAGLDEALHGAPADEDERRHVRAEVAARRDALWNALMPSAHCKAVTDVPPERVPALRAVLDEEGVSSVQARVVRERERRYPAGEYEVLGSWGWRTGDEPAPVPRDGLERLAAELVGGAPAEAPPLYRYLVQRSAALGRTAYFLDRGVPPAAPAVRTTLDLDLQRFVRARLAETLHEHRAAVAMAVAVDLATGDVLAVDSVEAYEVEPFAPVYYAFTPGSTFKMVTMAVALQEGAVRPEHAFDVGAGHYRLPGSSRVIREAEGSLTGEITATDAFAHSVNAGLVQIGARLDADTFRGAIRDLGYARAPLAGLGVEHPGWVPPLPWKPAWEQASISFGHELLTTLWQHAAALAAIVRGGEWLPLRLVRAVEADGERVELPVAAPTRVLAADACATVRWMMEVGAREGTGRHVARPHLDMGLEMGTKTGTAEKVPTEVCAHLAGRARVACQEAGLPFDASRLRALRGQPRPHRRSCYTSSMCAFGRLPGTEREVLVLVVVDEPTGKEKYGSRVAGPAAVAILAEALGATRGGATPEAPAAPGFARSDCDLGRVRPEPWRPALEEATW